MDQTFQKFTDRLHEIGYCAVIRIGSHDEDLEKPFSCWLWPRGFVGKEVKATSTISVEDAIEKSFAELKLQMGGIE